VDRTPRVFVTQEFMRLPNWHDLYVDFYNFKICEQPYPIVWGRDSSLYQTPLWHIQLTDLQATLDRWAKIEDPFKRTIKESEAAHDSWLIYAKDPHAPRYLLIRIFGPNAHSREDQKRFLTVLKVEVADKWINGTEYYEPPE